MTPVLVFFLVLLVIGGIVAAIAAGISRARSTTDAWKAAARRLGCTFQKASMFKGRRIGGVVEGYGVSVKAVHKSNGSSGNNFTVDEIDYPDPLDFTMKIRRSGPLSGLAGIFGAQDIEVGDPDFDEAVVIKGHPARAVRDHLTADRRHAILELLRHHKGAVVSDDGIQFTEGRTQRDPGVLVANVEALLRTAKSVASEQAEAIDKQTMHVVDLTAEEEEEAHAPEPAPPQEVLMAIAREAEAVATDALPLEADFPAAVAPSPPPQPSPPPPPPPPPTVPTPDASLPTLDAADVCSSLFGERRMSYEVAAQFAQHYEGRRVRGKAVLDRLSSYTHDADFGREPGTKATLEVCGFGETSALGRTARVVLQLPSAAAEELKGSRGATLQFAGRLVRCDAFMRTLHVADGDVGRT